MSISSASEPPPENFHYLIKFLLMSVLSFFVGTVHGLLQVIPAVRAWLDSIGSPYGGPGHMIDPLAHAHINLVGGVTILGMAVTYYMLPMITKIPLYSRRLAEHSFWWTTVGVSAFYISLMIFGVIEGDLFLNDPAALPAVHKYYGPVISVAASILAVGFWIYLANVALSVRNFRRSLRD
ncbi:MAG: cbb3-type cytochrome c oxidase subunit I [Mariprofundaceae bacterium]|nr:cbb3-type cytochrome c oxidase subunit I [Mariprofundaceae bacterium]